MVYIEPRSNVSPDRPPSPSSCHGLACGCGSRDWPCSCPSTRDPHLHLPPFHQHRHRHRHHGLCPLCHVLPRAHADHDPVPLHASSRWTDLHLVETQGACCPRTRASQAPSLSSLAGWDASQHSAHDRRADERTHISLEHDPPALDLFVRHPYCMRQHCSLSVQQYVTKSTYPSAS